MTPPAESTGTQAGARRISARVGGIAESATLAVDARAKELRAAGERVISFGAGEPDFPTPAHIVEAAIRAAADPRFHRYTPAAGLPELREAIAEKTRRDSGFDVEPGQVVVTNGAKQACYEAFATLLDPGDEVLVPAPYWVTYPEAVRLAGGVAVPVPTDERSGFRATVDDLEAARTSRTKLLVFVSPSNPTGAVYPPDEVEALGRWAAERDVWVLTDEIYEHFVYGGSRFASMPARVPDLADRCVVVNGVSKTYAMTGWRVGWLVAPTDVATAVANLQSHLTSNVANVSQAAALAALAGGLGHAADMRAAFDRRRRIVHEGLSAVDGVSCAEAQGAFYVLPSMRGLLDQRGEPTTLELASLLLEEARVAVVPGEAFGAPEHVRLSYALADDDLVEGLDRMTRWLGGKH